MFLNVFCAHSFGWLKILRLPTKLVRSELGFSHWMSPTIWSSSEGADSAFVAAVAECTFRFVSPSFRKESILMLI